MSVVIKVPNKYNLKVSDIKSFKLLNKDKLKSRCWYNSGINAWCYIKSVWCVNTSKGIEYVYTKPKGCYSYEYGSIFVIFYDKPKNGKLIGVDCTLDGDTLSYKFNSFYSAKACKSPGDIALQEVLLEFANWLLDEEVCTYSRIDKG